MRNPLGIRFASAPSPPRKEESPGTRGASGCACEAIFRKISYGIFRLPPLLLSCPTSAMLQNRFYPIGGTQQAIETGFIREMNRRICVCCGELMSAAPRLSRNPNMCASCSSLSDGLDECVIVDAPMEDQFQPQPQP